MPFTLSAQPMRLACILAFLFAVTFVFADTEIQQSLRALDDVVAHRNDYVEQKNERIDRLKTELKNAVPANRYTIYFRLYEAYKTFIYDSAFTYARKLQEEAYRSHDASKIAFAKVKLGFILVSSGMFNEALDSLHTVNRTVLADSQRVEFYSLMARTYYDLVDFNRDQFFTELYTSLGNRYIDSALQFCDSHCKSFYSLRAMMHLRRQAYTEATEALEKVLNRPGLTYAELAIAASTQGYIYLQAGKIDDAVLMLIKASEADVRSSTKETLAILNLAELLYKKGDVVRAYEYVKVAMDDANFYGARHRKIQVAAIFPIIEGHKLNTVEHQRKLLITYAILITILSVITIVSAVIIYKQFRKLKQAEAHITKANANLQEANALLQEVNNRLMEANKIKEEYIGYYFNINSEYLVKIQAFKQAIDTKLMTKKYDDIRYVVNNINLKKEREELYLSFDKVFLKLFPDFVTTFNSFFKEEDRIILKEGQLLNTELRIFALIRMGIHDTEKIAKILDYSINTIYNYKARTKSKSSVPNDEFEQKIMAIKAL
jgi:predicted negative regulator of RcsB-dependent stress response